MPAFPTIPLELICPAVIEVIALTVMLPPLFADVFKLPAVKLLPLVNRISPPLVVMFLTLISPLAVISTLPAVTSPDKLTFSVFSAVNCCALIVEFPVTLPAFSIARFPNLLVAPTAPLKVMLPLPASRFRLRALMLSLSIAPKAIFPPAVLNTASFVKTTALLILMLPLFVVTLPPNLVFNPVTLKPELLLTFPINSAFDAVTFKTESGAVTPIFPCTSTLPVAVSKFNK